MSEQQIVYITATELRSMARKLSTYLEMHPQDKEARLMADRCGQIAASLEAQSPYQRLGVIDPRYDPLEDRVLRVASGAPLTRRELRFAGLFALMWFAMDAFWFISTFNHWFGL